MSRSFADTLKKIRTEQGLSQQQLADKLFVDRSSVANWESGRRVPNAMLITRIAESLSVDIGMLMTSVNEEEEAKPRVIVLDDEKIILRGEMATLTKVMPNASISAFTNPELFNRCLEHWCIRIYGKAYYRRLFKKAIGALALPGQQIGELML